ncbi:hypothetical protein F5Y06DRAFT_45469 [Hypoxylon sp. FL0890]|nr:hypothetical protein F5Y06DRAFT_45469 [Hypoxylon sp. FL0890]
MHLHVRRHLLREADGTCRHQVLRGGDTAAAPGSNRPSNFPGRARRALSARQHELRRVLPVGRVQASHRGRVLRGLDFDEINHAFVHRCGSGIARVTGIRGFARSARWRRPAAVEA